MVQEEGKTPLEQEELDQLIPQGLATREELNQLEQYNIVQARKWAFRRKRKEVLQLSFLLLLHQKMFNFTWKWAGKVRTTEKNIGVDKALIFDELQKLCDDVQYWIGKHVYPWDQTAARFHHRLVATHPFSNGNGRHARLMTDLLLWNYDQPEFSWGQLSRESKEAVRLRYLAALRKADQGDFSALLKFVRS